MRALFIGGTVDNSELDLAPGEVPQRWPAEGSGTSRYRLHHLGEQDSEPVYAVYAAPEMADEEVMRIAARRDYARRFEATVRTLH
jgi:hypothetical protein